MSKLSRFLAVTAHPDDESFLFGGALALHVRAGGTAALLCLTDGQAGRTGGLCKRAELGRVRREELHRAAAILGIATLYTPGLMDGELDAVGDEEGARLVADYADRFGADLLLTFGPEGASGHADHKACWRWTRRAAGGRRLYAASFPPGVEGVPPGGAPLPVTTIIELGDLADRKRLAFLEHRTQQDHLARFDMIMGVFQGKEYYHRVQPPWPPDSSPEAALA